MSFSFEKKVNLLEVNTTYEGVITNVSMVNQNTDKERVLVNVRVEGFAQPQPASYATSTETGARMLTELFSSIDATPSKDINKVFESCKGKKVKVRLAMASDNVHINTTIQAPSVARVVEIEEEEPVL